MVMTCVSFTPLKNNYFSAQLSYKFVKFGNTITFLCDSNLIMHFQPFRNIHFHFLSFNVVGCGKCINVLGNGVEA